MREWDPEDKGLEQLLWEEELHGTTHPAIVFVHIDLGSRGGHSR